MKKTLLIFMITIFASGDLVSQINAGSTGSSAFKNRNDNEEIMNQFYKGIRKNSDAIDDYEGTPYLYKDFKRGILRFPDHDPLVAQVRYDVTKEQMQVKFDEESYRVLHDAIPVEIGNDLYEKYSYRGDEKHVDLLGYFRVVTQNADEDDLVLLEKPYKKVKRGKAAAAMQKARPPKYLDKSDYYLMFPNSNSAVQVERRQKRFLKVFPEEHQDDLQSFIKDNKLKPKREEDLKQIVNYYNSSLEF